MASRNPTSSSHLTAGPSGPSYGAFGSNKSTPSHRPNYNPSPSINRFASPGPTSSQSPQGPPQYPKRQTSRATCLKIVLFQLFFCLMVVYRSNSLANFVDLKSKARRASMEASALVAQREKWEWEKEDMRHDREVWGKAPENHVPPGAYWYYVSSIYRCRAYGKREYDGELRGIPKGWSPMDACMNTPVSIRVRGEPPINLAQPHRCAFASNSPNILGYWMVDQYQSACEPKLRNINDIGCTNYRSGLTRIEGQVVGIINIEEPYWRVMCESMPFTWNNFNYTSPSHCEERDLGTKVAVWDVPAESCR